MCEEELAAGALTELLTGYVIDPGAIPGFVFGGNERLTTHRGPSPAQLRAQFQHRKPDYGIRKSLLQKG